MQNLTSALTRDQRIQTAYAADTILAAAPYNVLGVDTDDGAEKSKSSAYTSRLLAQSVAVSLDMNGLLGLRAISQTDFLVGNFAFESAIINQMTSNSEEIGLDDVDGISNT